MIKIYLREMRCIEETDEAGDDEPYALVTAVNLRATTAVTATAPGVPQPVTIQVPAPSSTVVLYDWTIDFSDGDRQLVPGAPESFWGINGFPAPLTDPDDVIFMVSLIEEDDGQPGVLRGLVRASVVASVAATMTFPRDDRVRMLREDLDSILDTPTGAPNYDDVIGTQELRFTAQELADAENFVTVRKDVEIAGDGGRYRLTFEARNPAWRTYPLGTGADRGGRTSVITAVSREHNTMEVFWTSDDGSVQDRHWFEGQGWKGFRMAPPGSAAAEGGITCVSRNRRHIELWWVTPQGGIDARWFDGDGWHVYQAAPPGSAAIGGGIAAVSRAADAMELWFVTPQGAVEGSWFDGDSWHRYQVAGDGSASTTAGLTALSRSSTHMELWWVRPDQSIAGRWFDGNAWHDYTLAPPGSAHPDTRLASVTRRPDTMELWWIDPDGAVRDAYWYDAARTWRSYPVTGRGAAAPSAGLAAVSRIPQSMEVWWIAPDGTVRDAFWYEGRRGFTVFDVVGRGSASTTAGLAAVSRQRTEAWLSGVTRVGDSMELWYVDSRDGTIHGAYWYA
ncbi:MAG: hypothetical protein HOV79_02780 [Hamadaea sp.]|nr:hypothetical protein [Hamadaea sp.]